MSDASIMRAAIDLCPALHGRLGVNGKILDSAVAQSLAEAGLHDLRQPILPRASTDHLVAVLQALDEPSKEI